MYLYFNIFSAINLILLINIHYVFRPQVYELGKIVLMQLVLNMDLRIMKNLLFICWKLQKKLVHLTDPRYLMNFYNYTVRLVQSNEQY